MYVSTSSLKDSLRTEPIKIRSFKLRVYLGKIQHLKCPLHRIGRNGFPLNKSIVHLYKEEEEKKRTWGK